MQNIKDGRLQNTYIYNLSEVLDLISVINPTFSKRIQEKYNQLKDFPFLVVNYPFGERIIHKRDVFLPIAGGGSISVNNQSLPPIIRDNFSYTKGVNNPVGLILNKESEFYLSMANRIVSYPTINVGQMFGFVHIVDAVMKKKSKASVSIWNLDAGARTSFILPKISENNSHTNLLRTYRIDVEKPSSYTDQSKIFSALNNSINNPWTQSVLYFPRQLLERIKTDPTFLEIYQEMCNIHRSSYNIWHNTYTKWDNDLALVFQEAKINKLSGYAINIAKHIYLTIAGGVSCFAPATDENMLPKKLIEKAYSTQEGYGLSQYWPTIMQPKQFDFKEPVYYSISLPTLINYNPETFTEKTSIALLVEVATILDRCQKYLINKFDDYESFLYETAIKVKFSFYHDDPNPQKYRNLIKNSTLIPEEDSRFYKKGWAFPAHSQFVRGCIKIEPLQPPITN
ncbi:MAG: hypothetical protein K0R49_921 [Burkholderiales bacterium]|jgi:hypothetical protein|nr:hypothetical protein [Burkholderiales bacterium]MCE3268669.1 hypothetical protein [Burkholderiales bacterium]